MFVYVETVLPSESSFGGKNLNVAKVIKILSVDIIETCVYLSYMHGKYKIFSHDHRKFILI